MIVNGKNPNLCIMVQLMMTERKILKDFYINILNYCKKLRQEHIDIYSDETWENRLSTLDESWLHDCDKNPDCHLCKLFLEFANDDACKARIAKGYGGHRFVVLHAMSSIELLTNYDDEKQIQLLEYEEQLDFEQSIPNAECIFEAKNDHTGDYHLQMNSTIYNEWGDTRLIPAIDELYEDKTGVLVVDIAPYHCSRTGFPASSASKTEIIQCLKLHGINEIKILRYNQNPDSNQEDTEHTFGEAVWHRRAPRGPYKCELFLYLYEWLKKNKPDALIPDFMKLMRQCGHNVIYTVANNPDDQPFELLNAYVKRYCKKKCLRNRTMMELFQHLREGFYGGVHISGQPHRAVNQHIIQGWIAKCHGHMNQEILDILKIKNKTIENLWYDGCGYSINDPYIKCPWRQKTLKDWGKEFSVVIE
jgi:hypothetical protein